MELFRRKLFYKSVQYSQIQFAKSFNRMDLETDFNNQ